MIDFLMISTRSKKNGLIEIYPKFIIKKSSDLMIRGGDFYAIWIEERGLWSTDEQDALQLIDRELDRYAEENRNRFDSNVKVLHMWDSESGMIDSWHKYCQKQMRDSFHMLDEKLIFSNTPTNKKDYASKRLGYPLEAGETPAYDKLMSTLYEEEERRKIEWAIGSIISGESKKLQKFMVLYGAAGTGKSTVLNIIQQLFEGYYSVFDAKALGSSSNAFALEAFKDNPLVAIQHDGDLSKIEDNTRLNSLVSHERMTVNEKFKSTYSNSFKCFLFMGTNKPVKITDAKSGLIRRLIDVSPSGEKLSPKEYKHAVKQVGFELGPIAHHCQEVYLSEPGRYDDYIPITMLGASNDFYNFVVDSYHIFKKEDGTTLKSAWEMYKTYCDDAKVAYPFSQRVFKEELKNYFKEYKERFNLDDGTRLRSYYSGFRTEKFEDKTVSAKEEDTNPKIRFDSTESLFDQVCADCPAQYATSKETPSKKWDEVTTKLSELDTSKIHYVKIPENHIVIDFDIPGKNGEKSFEKNLEEASKWPPTYAELSKSGAGIHLHYIYTGDASKLSRVYDDHIEVKVFTGKSSLRRKLSKCNNLSIAQISSGLPLKGENKMVNFEGVKSEKSLRTQIKRNLNKEIHDATKPSVDFIYKILEDAYASGLHYAKARTMLDGALVEYIDQLENGTAWFTAEDLAQALKIVINSVYGLTAANFENPFRDPRNKDNIVAKRGALFMTLLKSEVEKRGFCVAHIKTDSIKIPDATPEIMDFVIRFGKEYGYLFETEANFEKFCLVNDAVYVAKFKDGKHAGEWTATGTQFQVPYVFKKLFSKEPIEFKDMCETKSVTSALYLDMNENLPDVSEQEKDLERIVKKAREFGVDMDTSGHSGDSELDSMVGEISKGHNYIFIGKVGQFCPIKPGCGGGLLMRETENKKTGEKGYAAAASSKGYRWLESEMVRELGKEESIDLSYYDNMVTEAVKTISQYGDFEWFVSDDPYVPDTPPWQEPSEPWNDRTPYDVR